MIGPKKIALFAVSGMLTVGLAVGGATYALFTSEVTNANSVVAGTINLAQERDHGDYVPGPMFYPDYLDPIGKHPYDKTEVNPSGEAIGGWAPGDKVQRTMILKNTGTLDAKIVGIKATPRASFTQSLLGGGTGTATGLISGAAYEEFIQKAKVTVAIPDENIKLYEGSLANLISPSSPLANGYAAVLTTPVLTGTTPPFTPGPLNVTFEVELDRTAGNDLQDKDFIFDFSFYAEQARNN